MEIVLPIKINLRGLSIAIKPDKFDPFELVDIN